MKKINRRKYTPKGDHTRYVNSDNCYVASITTILKLLGKDALIKWANYLGWKRKRVEDELERASSIGTLSHMYIEKIIKGESFDLGELDMFSYEVREGVINSLNSFVKWWKKNKHRVELIDIELKMCCSTYGGTADFVCLLDGVLTIIDFKTSGNFYFTMFLQLAAYAKLYMSTVNKNSVVENLMVLRLDKKHGQVAETMDVHDLCIKSSTGMTSSEIIDFYIEVFEKITDLYYDIYEISQDWGSKD